MMVRTSHVFRRTTLTLTLAAAVLAAAVPLGAEAGGYKAATGHLIEIPLFTSTADEGAVVIIAGTEIGATRRLVGDTEVTVPVAGIFLRERGPFSVPAGTDRLIVTVGERMGGFDSPFFVAAIFVPDDARIPPHAASAPVYVNFASVDGFLLPDQEDSPGLTYPGPGIRVFARTDGDETGFVPAPPRRGRGRLR